MTTYEPKPIDTTQFETHAEWCQWLWTRMSLKEEHRACMGRTDCVARLRDEKRSG